MIATASGVIASVFAAPRMLAMLTRMKEVPHRHFGLPGTVRTHTMLYTVTFAMVLIVAGERLFIWSHTDSDGNMDM